MTATGPRGQAWSSVGRFAIVDVETTGLDPGNGRVLECAVVGLDAKGEAIEEWSSLVTVPGEGELGASWLHGITRPMLAGAPPFDGIAAEVVSRITGRVVVGHVLAFDLAYLTAEFARCGIRLPDLSAASICTRELARTHLPPGPRTLAACCAALGVRTSAAHTALGDARATASIFAAFLRSGAVIGTARLARRARRVEWPMLALQAEVAWPRAAAR